jgi:hypothetical protein
VPADFVKAWLIKRADTIPNAEHPERILWTSADVLKTLNVSPRAEVTEIWVQKVGRVMVHQPEPELVPWAYDDDVEVRPDILRALDHEDPDD